ncbi:hypothetical protein V6N13_020171 [Hibiscus sabdariffa]
MYDEKDDFDHFSHFINYMHLFRAYDQVKYIAFSMTLRDIVQAWTELEEQGSQAIIKIEHTRILKPTRLMRLREQREQSDKRCEFHNEQGHYTNDYAHMRDAIELAVRIGQLERFVVVLPSNRHDKERNNQEA